MSRRFRQSILVIGFGLLAAVLVSSFAPVDARAQTPPSLAGCPLFPHDSVWNTSVETLPVHPDSSSYITNIGATKGLHPDFGSGTWDGGPIGIPFNVVPGSQAKVAISFDYADESDSGPYPIPPNPAIEGGNNSTGDRHILVLDKDNCVLYETWSTYPNPDGTWQAGSGAMFDLRSNTLRPAGWTSSDAAGLPILPGLVRYDEVASGEIRHAIRFTAPKTRKAYVWPARHYASSLTSLTYPPMGQRFRLKATFDVTGFSQEVQVILRAMKTYGIILADNGSAWFISGVPDERWNNDVLVSEFARIKGSDFEAIDESSLMIHPDSGQARQDNTGDAEVPTTPSNLMANAVSSSQINLSWEASTDNTGVEGYIVYRDGTQVATTGNTAYQSTGLTASTAYTYRVAAYDAAGNISQLSSEARATTMAPSDTQPPSVPTALTAEVLSSSQISLSWKASTDNVGVAGYVVYRNDAQVATVTDRAYTDGGLSPSTSYSYRVTAYDAAGNVSAKSTAVTRTTQPSASTKFSVGDRVQTTGKASVRSKPAGSRLVVGAQPAGARGTVAGGPWYYSGHWLWLINYDTGFDGWTQEDKLKAAQ